MKAVYLFLLVIFYTPHITLLKALPSLSTAFSSVAHWACSAGPSWLESYKYGLLLSDSYAMSLFGSEDANTAEKEKIYNLLSHAIAGDWKTIPIKLIKEELRPVIFYALVCTDSVIFINPEFYDVLPPEEQEAAIMYAGTTMSEKHVLKLTTAYAAIPFMTHFGTKLYSSLVRKITSLLPAYFQKAPLLNKLAQAHNTLVTSAPCKLLINTYLSTAYYKYQNQTHDLKTVKRLGSTEHLLNYYKKVEQARSSCNNFFTSLRYIPLEKRIEYLKHYK